VNNYNYVRRSNVKCLEHKQVHRIHLELKTKAVNEAQQTLHILRHEHGTNTQYSTQIHWRKLVPNKGGAMLGEIAKMGLQLIFLSHLY